jgi:hypothetical protein
MKDRDAARITVGDLIPEGAERRGPHAIMHLPGSWTVVEVSPQGRVTRILVTGASWRTVQTVIDAMQPAGAALS